MLKKQIGTCYIITQHVVTAHTHKQHVERIANAALHHGTYSQTVADIESILYRYIDTDIISMLRMDAIVRAQFNNARSGFIR